MAKQSKSLLVIPASHMGPGSKPGASLPIWLPVNAPGKVPEDGLSSWSPALTWEI